MNTVVPMIVMLGCSEIDMKVLDIDMKTAESDNYRKVLGDDGDTNGVLIIMQKRARFSYKDRRSLSMDCVKQASCISGPKSRKN